MGIQEGPGNFSAGNNPIQNHLPHPMPPPAEQGNIYERIEEITESMIDERWDELIGEVKKIVEWKGRIEDTQRQINSDLQKMKEDSGT